jgi:hypothetical protein
VRQFIHGPAGAEDSVARSHDQTLPQAGPAANHGTDDASPRAQAAGDLADGESTVKGCALVRSKLVRGCASHAGTSGLGRTKYWRHLPDVAAVL